MQNFIFILCITICFIVIILGLRRVIINCLEDITKIKRLNKKTKESSNTPTPGLNINYNANPIADEDIDEFKYNNFNIDEFNRRIEILRKELTQDEDGIYDVPVPPEIDTGVEIPKS